MIRVYTKLKMDFLTMTIPLSGLVCVCHCGLGLATINLSTEFEISDFIDYEYEQLYSPREVAYNK